MTEPQRRYTRGSRGKNKSHGKTARCKECRHRSGAHHPHHCDGKQGREVLTGKMKPCRCTTHKFRKARKEAA